MDIIYGQMGGYDAAWLADSHGDKLCVVVEHGTLIVECLSSDGDNEGEPVCAALDRPHAEALLGLLQRWLDTGALKPSEENKTDG